MYPRGRAGKPALRSRCLSAGHYLGVLMLLLALGAQARAQPISGPTAPGGGISVPAGTSTGPIINVSVNNVLNPKATPFYASGSNQTATCSGTIGSTALTCPAGVADFIGHYGITVPSGGTSNTLATPAAPAVVNTSVITAEAGNIGACGGCSITPANTPTTDFGVQFTATGGNSSQGQPLTEHGSAPVAQWQYHFTGGVYNFFSSDANKAVSLAYEYTDATGGTSHTYKCIALKLDGSFSAASPGTINATGPVTLSWLKRNDVTCGVSAGADAYGFYRDNVWIGSTGTTLFHDNGAISQNRPWWIPSSPTGAGAAPLVTSVTAVGTTSLALTAALVNTVSAVAVRHSDSVAIQAAITACVALGAGGCAVEFPPGTYLANIINKTGVALRGPHIQRGASVTGAAVVLQSGLPGAVIDSDNSGNPRSSVEGLALNCLGAGGLGDRGILLRRDKGTVIKNVTILACGDQGIQTQINTVANTIFDVQAPDSLRDHNRIEHNGALDVDGSDNYIGGQSEFGAALQSYENSPTSLRLYVDGIVIRGGTTHIDGLVVGELSDEGVYAGETVTSASYPLFIVIDALRVDHNFGHGIELEKGIGQFLGLLSLDNGIGLNNYFDAIHTDNNAIAQWQVSDFSNVSNTANRVRYGIWDAGSGSEYTNPLIGPTSFSTARYFAMPTTNPAKISFAVGTVLPLTGTTPDVSAGDDFFFNNAATPTTVTNFLGGIAGHTMCVRGDGYTTIQNAFGSTDSIRTLSDADELLGNPAASQTGNEVRCFRYTGESHIWIEVGEKNPAIWAIPYSASMTPDLSKGTIQTINVTNNSAFTIHAPVSTTRPSQGGVEWQIVITNSSGGVAGAVTFDAGAGNYVVPKGITAPANAETAVWAFLYDGVHEANLHRMLWPNAVSVLKAAKYAVGALPACAAPADEGWAIITDHNAGCAYGAAPAAGAANVCPVFCNGAAWTIH